MPLDSHGLKVQKLWPKHTRDICKLNKSIRIFIAPLLRGDEVAPVHPQTRSGRYTHRPRRGGGFLGGLGLFWLSAILVLTIAIDFATVVCCILIMI